MPEVFSALLGLGGLMTGAVSMPPPAYGALPARVEKPSVINDGPFLHAIPVPTQGCGEYVVSVHGNTNYGQVRGKPSLSGRPLWRLITGSNVTICSKEIKDIKTDQRNIPWIWVKFKSREEPRDHEGYMSFRLLEPVVAPPVAGADRPKPEAENPQEFPQPEAPNTIRPDAPIIIGGDESADACASSGDIIGLDPQGDGFLSVRSGPGGPPFREIDRLFNGNEVYVCASGGPWLAAVYSDKRDLDPRCGVSKPWRTRQPYTGPCRYGWIHSRYVRMAETGLGKHSGSTPNPPQAPHATQPVPPSESQENCLKVFSPKVCGVGMQSQQPAPITCLKDGEIGILRGRIFVFDPDPDLGNYILDVDENLS